MFFNYLCGASNILSTSILKTEVHGNSYFEFFCRYDLLCFEGLVQALRVFLGIDPIPKYTVASISCESMLKMHVKPEVCF